MVAKTYGVRLSTIARELFPQLSWVSAYEWYALDVVGVQVYNELLRRAHDDGEATTGERVPGAGSSEQYRRWRQDWERSNTAPAAKSQGEDLVIRGDEIPPWQR